MDLIIFAITVIILNLMWAVVFWLFVPQQQEKKLNPLKPLLPHKKSATLSNEELVDLTDIPTQDIIKNMIEEAKDKGGKK